jgi:hypothetical protein
MTLMFLVNRAEPIARRGALWCEAHDYPKPTPRGGAWADDIRSVPTPGCHSTSRIYSWPYLRSVAFIIYKGLNNSLCHRQGAGGDRPASTVGFLIAK